MQTEHSCGAVVFTRENGKIQYLLVQNLSGIYGFPKGHMEAGESERDTAVREIREETGLEVRFLEGFRAVDEYPSPAITGWRKQVVYFLAEAAGVAYTLQAGEILGGGLYAFPEGLALLPYESSRRILQEANDFLLGK